jgi:hypothetical protein
MRTTPVRNGIQLGTLAGAATAGAIVGLGYRHEYATPPFEILGRAVAGTAGTLLASSSLALVVGLVAHFTLMGLWGVGFALLAGRLRGVRLVAAAVVFSAFVGALSATVAPLALGGGATATLTVPQTVFYLALLAISLSAGTRFARPVE